MNGVFQYLGGADNPDFVIIHLPEDRVFSSAGRPAVIKAAEYSRSGSN
jgi:hypothetical protein